MAVPTSTPIWKLRPPVKDPPARGEIAVHYDSGKSIVELGNSWLELPHSRVDVSGVLGVNLTLKAQSSDVKDLLPALDLTRGDPLPAITFDAASFEGAVAGPLANPKISGHAAARNLNFDGRLFDSIDGQVALSADSASVRNGLISVGGVPACTGCGLHRA